MSKQSANNLRDKDRDYFDTNHLEENLKRRSVRGGAVTIAAQASKFVLKLGSTAVLARLLVPEDYGLIGMATVIVGFVEYFKDLGLSAATIQQAKINHQQVSTLFWINVVIGCLVALVVALFAPAVALIYQEPRLRAITLCLAISFVFSGLTVQHQALLQRQMEFSSLAKIEIIAMINGIVGSIISAYYGAGYWSLVILQLFTVVSNAIGVWLFCRWRPGLPSRNANIGSMLNFGRDLTGFNIINYFSRNLDNFLIGRVWGAQQLGLYAKAYQLVLLPINQINVPVDRVALPALSRLQNDPERYQKYYGRALLAITFLGMPLVMFLCVSADKVILLLLGKEWLKAIPIFQFLIPAAFIGTFNLATGWVYQSLNRNDRQLRWGIFSSVLNVIIFVVAIKWGALGIAAAYGLSRIIIVIPAIVYCYRGTWLKLTDFFAIIFLPTFGSIGAAIGVFILQRLFLREIELNTFASFSLDCLVYILFYGSIWCLIPQGRKRLRDILQIVVEYKKIEQIINEAIY
ncbi:MAG: lipopolysaccharide biosynthesis protein [Hyellaceae cyanobacterium CSU_1_1]|nr:lipopolysaccharide biosynthesis protein [Hyellaceae cyanobacterium CSU_1_1]